MNGELAIEFIVQRMTYAVVKSTQSVGSSLVESEVFRLKSQGRFIVRP